MILLPTSHIHRENKPLKGQIWSWILFDSMNNLNPKAFLNESEIEFIQRGEVVILVSFLEHYLFLYFDPLNIKNLFPSSEGFFFSFCEKKNQKDIFSAGTQLVSSRYWSNFEMVSDTKTNTSLSLGTKRLGWPQGFSEEIESIILKM